MFKRWRSRRRGVRDGANLRAIHELLDDLILEGEGLRIVAQNAAQRHYSEHLWVKSREDLNYIRGFAEGYQRSREQAPIPAPKDVPLWNGGEEHTQR